MENKLNNRKQKQASLYEMKTVGYYLMSLFQFWKKMEFSQEVLSKLIYEEYHNFSKTRLPFNWYEHILEKLELTTDDLLIEVAKVDLNHDHDLHYHKLSHAICIILGEEEGFYNCGYGQIIKDEETIRTFNGLEVYFPSYCKHTFNAPYSTVTGSLYFLSIQSPPLLTEERDDFYFINKL